ncbi:MAG TPA: class I SAM-dependent methyltransferase [Methylophaga sp.]|nr:class I SAM-dependent methyltransferase [Methylophaga sp.]
MLQLPDAEREKALYLTHNNDVDDPRYQAFVSPVTQAILAEQSTDKTGLDFGAGPGPVISHQLAQQGYKVILYDPFFHNNINALNDIYDFIISCEVIEHFHHPALEFARLRALLKPGGSLYCMTELFSETVDFANWYYKNDPTHVCFYHVDCLPLIAERFGFSQVRQDGRLIVFGV